MAETWLYLVNKTGERCAVQPKDFAEKHTQGFRLDPDVGGQEAPKRTAAADNDHKAASDAKKD